MLNRDFNAGFARIGLSLLLVGLLGWITGAWTVVLVIALIAYLGWSLLNMSRLHRWLENGGGQAPESWGAWADIFDRIHHLQQANRAQHAQNQRIIGDFRGMTNAFPDATLLLSANDTITWFNDAAERLLGLQVPEDVGQPVTNLIREPDFSDWMAIDGKVESHFEMASPMDPNTRLNLNSIRYREDQRLLILRDVTDIHNLEQVRRDFVANVSHELRTPLTVLVGYLEAIHDGSDGELLPVIERMQEQAGQMQELLGDLLELSRLQSEERNPEHALVDVCAILMQLREQAEEMSQGQHQIILRCESGLQLTGNMKDLESAFRNLIGNAIHYTPANGQVTIEWSRDERGMILSVSDTGIGIPNRDIPRLTERFYRVGTDRSRHRGGTGLGLAIVKHVLNAHNGRLEIHSDLGEGSTFSCIFPVPADETSEP